MYVLNSDEMRAADAHAIQDLGIPSLVLMENAAARVADVIVARNPMPRPLCVVCGKGNNGGDGMATARLLQQRGWSPVVLLLGRAKDLKADPAENWSRAIDAGVSCRELEDVSALESCLSDSDLVIDALFGTGLSKPLDGIFSGAVQKINQSGKEVISIDVPSGVSSDSGELLGPAIRAQVTVALAALKYCHVLSPACRMCGETYVVDIGIPATSTTSIVHSDDLRRLLPHRKPDSHKGSFGHAAVVAGSTGKSGAAYMAGKAALRSGAGLVTVISPSAVQPVIATLGPEIMTEPAPGNPNYFDTKAGVDVLRLLEGKSAVAIGPGMGTAEDTKAFFQQIVPEIRCALVIDADGLNLAARDLSVLRKRKPLSTLLTPHPGEMARLLGATTQEIQKDRIGAAKKLASETQSIVVLKGYRTVLADPEGRVRINLTGGPALASGGTGDILTGVLAGFLAQGLATIDAAVCGVFLHGFVANLFEAEYPQQALNAMDILNYWNKAVHLTRTRKDLEDEYLNIHFNF